MQASFGFIYSLFALILPKVNTKNPLRVIGGSNVVEEQYRFIVPILVLYTDKTEIQPRCTGSVISPTWTLTAYHCELEKTDEYSPAILYFNNLDYNYNDTSKYNVHYFVHPPSAKNLLGSIYVNDISLAKTDPIDISVYGKLCAVDYRALYGHEVIVFGYGKMNHTKNENGGQMELDRAVDLRKPLQFVKAMLHNCRENRKFKITERYLVCLGFACNRQSYSCYGDSGGPIIHPQGGIVAVVKGGSLNSICIKNLNADPEIVRPNNVALGSLVEPNLSWITNRLRDV